ncbi:HmuY family protein [Ekhidna sp.]
MKNLIKGSIYLAVASIMMLFTACGDDDTTTVPINLNFANSDLGLSESVELAINFSRPSETSGQLILGIATSLNYGTEADFYTDPEIINNEIIMEYETGDESVNLTISAGSSLNIAQDETITITVIESNEFELGTSTTATITVAENFIAQSGIIEIDGGGSEFPNQAFIDLSKLTQHTVDKYSWDIGFNTESGSHNVILNSSAYVMARTIDKTDIDDVSETDTVGFSAKMYISNYVDTEATEWIDHQSGDLSQTAFDISATNSENLVYIIKRDGDGRDWKKVRVVQDGDNYTLQYADINATTHSEVTISKDESYNFIHFDLDDGVVSVEPSKTSWDIMYGTYSGIANFGAFLAIGYNDYVILNRSNVSAAMIEEATVAYDAFTADDITSNSLVEDDISVIGSTWRSLVNFSLVLNEDVYYIIKDAEGNNYKLKFTRLSSESGERGYPEFKIELL